MEIQSFYIGKLKNNAHFEFHLEVKKMVEQHGADKLNIAELFKVYNELINKEENGLENVRQSDITKKLAKSDEERDQIFKGLYANIKSQTKHFDSLIVESAERLMIVFKNFGDIYRLSYNEETAAMSRLTKELTEEYMEDLKKTTTDTWVAKLKEINEAFRDLMLLRNEETAVKEPVNIRNLRKEIDEVYNNIIKRINASALLQGEENFIDFIAKLNNRVDYYKAHNM